MTNHANRLREIAAHLESEGKSGVGATLRSIAASLDATAPAAVTGDGFEEWKASSIYAGVVKPNAVKMLRDAWAAARRFGADWIHRARAKPMTAKLPVVTWLTEEQILAKTGKVRFNEAKYNIYPRQHDADEAFVDACRRALSGETGAWDGVEKDGGLDSDGDRNRWVDDEPFVVGDTEKFKRRRVLVFPLPIEAP